MKNILIIEDDTHIKELLVELLTSAGYQTTVATTGTRGLVAFAEGTFDLVLLDLMLPNISGEDVLCAIREIATTPVIILTAITDKLKTVELLKKGANDYMIKPFNNDELLARMAIWLKQGGHQQAKQVLTFKDLTVNITERRVTVAAKEVALSKREFGLLACMMAHPKKVFSKNNLYEAVWEDHFMGDENTINVHMSNLRNKLAKANPDSEYIQTVWGIGFKMRD